MTTMTQTRLGGWRIDTPEGSVELSAEASRDFARRVLGLARIERFEVRPRA